MINVLLCTYNGEKYLRELLDSIMRQTYREFMLYIMDDGSGDKSGEIIEEFSKKFPAKIRMVRNNKHLGYPDCFWYLLKCCEKADYYAFCDQDDVWRRDKLACVYEKFQKSNGRAGIPSLYIHEYYNCDKDLKLLSRHRLEDTNRLNDMSILFYTYASGFSMVIDNEMRDLLNRTDIIGNEMYHDELCIWVAYFYGRILYDNRYLVKYRRHEDTATKYGNDVFCLISNYIKREILGNEFGKKCRRIKTFLRLFDNKKIRQSTLRDWQLLSGSDSSLSSYFGRLFYPGRLRPSIGGELALRILFLLFKEDKKIFEVKAL